TCRRDELTISVHLAHLAQQAEPDQILNTEGRREMPSPAVRAFDWPVVHVGHVGRAARNCGHASRPNLLALPRRGGRTWSDVSLCLTTTFAAQLGRSSRASKFPKRCARRCWHTCARASRACMIFTITWTKSAKPCSFGARGCAASLILSQAA